MIIVLDTSAAVEIVLNRKKSSPISQKLADADWVITPSLFVSEITNVFWKYYQFGNLSIKECEEAIESALALPDDLIMEKELYKEAFSMACLTKKTAYDMFFLVLARRNNAFLMTVDKILTKVAEKHSIRTL